MDMKPSFENKTRSLSPRSVHNFDSAHKQDLEVIVQVLVKITSRTPEEIKPHLDTMIERLIKLKKQKSIPEVFDSRKWEADLKALTEAAENIPVLPPEAFTRESIYGNHD